MIQTTKNLNSQEKRKILSFFLHEEVEKIKIVNERTGEFQAQDGTSYFVDNEGNISNE